MPTTPTLRLTPLIWTRLGAAAALGALGAGLAGCTPGPAAPAASAPTAQAGEAGEAGEAGAQAALAGLSAPDAVGFNRWRLFGFVAIAQAEAQDRNFAEAGALIGQGLIEVFPTPPAGVDLAALAALDAELTTGQPRSDLSARLQGAAADLVRATPPSADTVRRLLELAAGLYGEADKGAAGVDPLEYQHSLGAVLAAQAALAALKANSANPAAFARTEAELTRLRALYAPVRAGETIAPHKDVLAQASRVELELAGVR